MIKDGFVTEELKNGKFVAWISGQVETPVALGATAEEATARITEYLYNELRSKQ
jgi:hypothetical protein